MACNGADTFEDGRGIGPYSPQGELACCQIHQATTALFLPAHIGTEVDAQLFGGSLLCPVHTLAPQSKLEPFHSAPVDVQIFHADPGEILTKYESFALSHASWRGGYGW